MIKLTQQQIMILVSAVEQHDGFASRPTKLKPAAAAKMSAKLIEQGLVRELRAKGSSPIWREGEDGRSYSLKILKAGRVAVASVAANGARVAENMSREDHASVSANGKSNPGRGSHVLPPTEATGTRTKRTLILELMHRDDGATLEDLIAATGWLPHTTRAALSGLRKTGVSIGRDRNEARGASVYRIAALASPTS